MAHGVLSCCLLVHCRWRDNPSCEASKGNWVTEFPLDPQTTATFGLDTWMSHRSRLSLDTSVRYLEAFSGSSLARLEVFFLKKLDSWTIQSRTCLEKTMVDRTWPTDKFTAISPLCALCSCEILVISEHGDPSARKLRTLSLHVLGDGNQVRQS